MTGQVALVTGGIRGIGLAICERLMNRGITVAAGYSVIGSAGGFGQANHAAAKSGMFGLTMSLAPETASKGITVNAVTPGSITGQVYPVNGGLYM